MIGRSVQTATGVVLGAGIIAGGLYWFFSRREAGNGSGKWGLGFGGGGSSLFGTKPPSGPSETEGPGGSRPKGKELPAGQSDDDTDNDNSQGQGASQGGQSGGGGGQSGTGTGTSGGGGKGGGGLGGGSGGGIGGGIGSGTSGGAQDGGDMGDDDGGGEKDGLFDAWDGLVIDGDLPPPDLAAAKLAALRQTIEDLVFGAILDPGLDVPTLPGPLHAFDPERGGVLIFWADVALHLEYNLPHGRLDPDNPSHIPWINLWLDILAYVVEVEQSVSKVVGSSPTESFPKILLQKPAKRRGDPLRRLFLRAAA